MEFTGFVVGGVVLGGAFIYLGRTFSDFERHIFGYSLLLAAFWYVTFGVLDARTLAELVPQIVSGAVFAALAILGIKRSLYFIGVGWLLHGGWDMISPLYIDASYAPHWTAPMCLGYDVLVGVYLLARSRGGFPIVGTASPA